MPVWIVILGSGTAALLLWRALRAYGDAPEFEVAVSAFGSASAPVPFDVHQWPHLGLFSFEVTDTGHHQAALRSALQQLGEHCVVTLDPRGGSLQNIGAPVAVLVEEVLVGFLSDGDATRFHRRLAYEGRAGQLSQCDARITVSESGWRGDKRMYGILLDLKPFRH